ncbi:MAG: RDD family protein [Terriglobales bacterium]
MTTGLTNCPTGGDPAVQGHRCATAAVELACSTAAETAAAEPNTDPNVDPNSDPNPDSWRVEVAARLERYRTRRKPRTPRYPSLLLPFDAPESWSRPAPPTGSAGTGSAAVATAPERAGQDFTFQTNFQTKEGPAAVVAPSLAEPRQTSEPSQEQGLYRYPEQSAKVIEFPRSAAIPVFRPSELADPILDRPRIVEVPEILPPPPALGGMLIEPVHQESSDTRAGAGFPLSSASPSASIARRALAALVDGAVLGTALAAFAAIVLRLNPSLNPVRGPLPMLAGALGVVAVLLGAAYEFLFVVYTGSTPGLRAARLRLAAFDGSPLNRRSRRGRVLASFLSAFAAGLGYLWCVLDQDGLCWHDRITRTHVQSSAQPE